MHNQGRQPDDKEVVKTLFQEMRYVELNELQAEHINYLMKALQEVAKSNAFNFEDSDRDTANRI